MEQFYWTSHILYWGVGQLSSFQIDNSFRDRPGGGYAVCCMLINSFQLIRYIIIIELSFKLFKWSVMEMTENSDSRLKFYTLEETAKILKISKWTIYANGPAQYGGLKMGALWRFREDKIGIPQVEQKPAQSGYIRRFPPKNKK